MCQSVLHRFLAQLPKCEHHMHLEGSLTPELLFRLAQRNGVKLPGNNGLYASVESYSAHLSQDDAFDDLESFLSLYYTGMSVLRTQEDYYDLATEYFQRAAQEGVRHAEVFFDPQAHTNRGIPYDVVLAGFKTACADAEARWGLTTKLILCFLRHLPAAQAMEHYTMARSDLLNGSISGIGLDSSEKGFPPELFQGVYAMAASDGIRKTAHAGEEAGPESVLGALDVLHAERIDHGRTIPEDPDLLSRIARQKTLVTVCPLSNLKLKGVSSIQQLPIPQFLKAGVRFSINSDDPAYFGGFIIDNYCAIQAAFNLNINDWRQISEAAIEGSWCNDARKAVLSQELEVVIEAFTKTREPMDS